MKVSHSSPPSFPSLSLYDLGEHLRSRVFTIIIIIFPCWWLSFKKLLDYLLRSNKSNINQSINILSLFRPLLRAPSLFRPLLRAPFLPPPIPSTPPPLPHPALMRFVPLPPITLLPFHLSSLLSIPFFTAFVDLDPVWSSSTWASTVCLSVCSEAVFPS